MLQPRSIFTGSDTTTPLDPSLERPRLSTPEYHDALNTTPDTAFPAPPAWPHASWTPTLPLDDCDRDPNRRAGSAPLRSEALLHAPLIVRTPPAVAGQKRPSAALHDYTTAASAPALSPSPLPTGKPASEPLHKRRRLHVRGTHSLGGFHLGRSVHFAHDGQPPSPLFFSARNIRPQLPARFSSSEAGARMLSNAREEGGIRTVTLARGTFSGLSPPGPASITSGRTSERSSLAPATSPEARDRGDPLRLLGSVGIVELLEADGRPTFIIDVNEVQSSPDLSNLQVIFANSALRSSVSLWDLISSTPPDTTTDEQTAHATSQFRAWLLSTASPEASPDPITTPNSNPAPIEHGGIIWSCYTLRRRLRVVSGAIPPHSSSSITSTTTQSDLAIPSVSSADLQSISFNSLGASSSSPRADEQRDYFGSTLPVGEPTPPISAPAPKQPISHVSRISPDDGSGLVPKTSHVGLPSAEDSSSFTNECVLRAQSAGDVDAFHREQNDTQDEKHDMGFFDWTRLALSPTLPRHIQFARSIDWASTPLGPIEYWSNDLRAMCNLIMYVKYSRRKSSLTCCTNNGLGQVHIPQPCIGVMSLWLSTMRPTLVCSDSS